jgi:hypothetical protein
MDMPTQKCNFMDMPHATVKERRDGTICSRYSLQEGGAASIVCLRAPRA